MRTTIGLTAILALSACASNRPAPSTTGHPSAEEAQILAVMDAYMHEISANDLEAMKLRQTPEGVTYRHRLNPDGTWDVRARSNMEWVAPKMATEQVYRERYWSPTVLIRGPMALVWAPYEFQIDGKISHCGIDAFSFSRIGGEWKVSNSMWTVEPHACDELRPADASEIRPR